MYQKFCEVLTLLLNFLGAISAISFGDAWSWIMDEERQKPLLLQRRRRWSSHDRDERAKPPNVGVKARRCWWCAQSDQTGTNLRNGRLPFCSITDERFFCIKLRHLFKMWDKCHSQYHPHSHTAVYYGAADILSQNYFTCERYKGYEAR